MEQEIYGDKHDLEAWDQRESERCFITIANAAQWISITGEAPPLSPISASEYTDAGLPWYSYYDAESKALEGAKALGDLKSFQKLYKEQRKSGYSEETLSRLPRVVKNIQRLIKSGSW